MTHTHYAINWIVYSVINAYVQLYFARINQNRGRYQSKCHWNFDPEFLLCFDWYPCLDETRVRIRFEQRTTASSEFWSRILALFWLVPVFGWNTGTNQIWAKNDDVIGIWIQNSCSVLIGTRVWLKHGYESDLSKEQWCHRNFNPEFLLCFDWYPCLVETRVRIRFEQRTMVSSRSGSRISLCFDWYACVVPWLLSTSCLHTLNRVGCDVGCGVGCMPACSTNPPYKATLISTQNTPYGAGCHLHALKTII